MVAGPRQRGVEVNVFQALWPLVVTLGVLIFVHEAGHFIAAKWAGIYVHRFSLGLGSPIPWLTRKIGETEYSISWLPLGGYVKMATAEEGADSSALEGGASENAHIPPDRMFEAKPVWKRMVVILAGVTMNALFAWVAFVFLAAKNGEQIDPVTTVGAVTVDSLPPGADALAAMHPGDTIVAVDESPVHSWNDIQELIASSSSDSVVVHLSDGRSLPIRIHPAALVDRARVLNAIAPAHLPLVETVESGRPGAKGGLQPGDTILALNDTSVASRDLVVPMIRKSAGTSLRFRVGRAGGQVELTITPEPVSEAGKQVGKIGVAFREAINWERKPYTLTQAMGAGTRATLAASTQIVRTVQGLLSARISSREVGGPILIGQLAAQSAQQGFDIFLAFMALISINLAILNLLPIPVLDGGQFLFLLAEVVLRRPPSLKLRERLTVVGLVLIVSLMVLAFSNDIRRLIGI
jgi:regulator of sigma E protease